MRQFNLEEAKAGKPVCTRDGKPARIICYDAKGTHPIIALVTDPDFEGEEVPMSYTNEGFFNGTSMISYNDLMLAPIKRKGWINIYKKDSTNNISDRGSGYIFLTKEQALDTVMSGQDYVTTTEIEWEE